jgi:hypothetical protein
MACSTSCLAKPTNSLLKKLQPRIIQTPLSGGDSRRPGMRCSYALTEGAMYLLRTASQKHPAVLGDGRHGVSTTDIPADLQRLKEAAHMKIGRWTSENVAHMGVRRTALLDEGEFHDAIDTLGALLRKYFLLVKGGEIRSLAPAILADWKAPFRQAWLPPAE